MDRRSYLRNVLILGVSGAGAFSLFKWFEITKPVDPSELRNKREIIAELSELIIPATSTPGAKDANVQDYIIEVLIGCNSIKQQRKFFSGIEDLEKYAIGQYHMDFLKCSAKQKGEVLDHFAQGPNYTFKIFNKIEGKLFGDSFYSKLKRLTIEGYCMSQLGATRGLAYDYIPGRYQACVPLQPNQKSWATR